MGERETTTWRSPAIFPLTDISHEMKSLLKDRSLKSNWLRPGIASSDLFCSNLSVTTQHTPLSVSVSISYNFQGSLMSGQPHTFPVKCLENQETFKTWVEKATCDIQCLAAWVPFLSETNCQFCHDFYPNKKYLKVKWGGHMSVKHSPLLVRLSPLPELGMLAPCWRGLLTAGWSVFILTAINTS